jgi:acyl-CoA hydrolase
VLATKATNSTVTRTKRSSIDLQLANYRRSALSRPHLSKASNFVLVAVNSLAQ